MDEHLAKNSDVSLVVVDSLSAFSWYDWIYRGNGRFVELKKYYDRMFSILLANIKKHKVVLLAVKQALFVKSSEDSSRKSQDEQEEQEMFQDHKVVQDDENDMDMEEGDVIENMTESEYLGYAWVSGVVCQVIVSKVRVDSKTHSGAFPKDVVVAGPRQAPRSVDSYCEHKEALFSVEVIKNKQSTKSYYVIGEEGVLWRRLAQIP
ncbi:hypothetical protein GWK47_004358 [Chionoecetes opilio]|uniref:Uncharacterized protein n=1 Tax=Chionoecetes opilio TaxID=41210 RepID=A0A8J4YFJ5_CHIOP|nr:hypothetical protein GWK47_004358 [Chionoecetes opilio]